MGCSFLTISSLLISIKPLGLIPFSEVYTIFVTDPMAQLSVYYQEKLESYLR